MKSFFTILLFTFISLTVLSQTDYTDKLLENSIYDSAPDNIKHSKAFIRERFFFEQRAYPLTQIPEGAYDKALRQRDQLRLTNSSEKVTAGWVSLGPTPGYYFNYGNISSRVVTGAYVPSNPQIIYIGPANGGVWKSTNGGTAWLPLTDNAASMSMGAIAIDPVNNNIVYAGTGEATYSGASYYGRGLLKSTDAGSSWTQITSGLPSSSYFSRIIIKPGNPSYLLAALGSSGLYRSTNAGVNWVQAVSGRIDDVLFSLTGDTVFAMGSGIGFRRSVDGGATFAVYGSGLPTASRMHFDMCRSNPAVMYAANYTSSSFLAYKSTNTGLTWTGISTSYDFNGGQAWYDMYVRVNPSNPNIAFIGAIDVHRTTDGGSTFTNITNGYGGGSVHVDNHYAFFHPTDSQTMIVCNDGGVWKSTNGGTSFTNLNQGLTLTQFYRIASSPFTAGRILGGTQDNGTQQTYSAINWAAAFGGDGGEVCFNPLNSNYILGETQNGGLQRTANGGTSWSSATSGITTTENVAWVAPIIAHPTISGTFYTARQSLYKSTNNGSSWTAVSSSINGTTAVRELCISKSDPAVIYASSSSKILKSTDGGVTFVNVTTGLPARTITSINIDPSDKNTVLLTFSGFSGGHVYKTTNAGASWSNISSNLPDSPVNDILIYRGDPLNNGFYFIGSDIGVFYTVNGGTSWIETYDGLPNTVIMHLDYSNLSGTLRAGTHGRGVYEAFVNQITTSPLTAYNLTTPAAGIKITTIAGNPAYYTFTWDASSPTATYKWTFSSPTTATPKLVVASASNTLSFTSDQLDAMLAAAGVQYGDSLTGQWDVMAYRNNAPDNDSLASANGPRTLTLKRSFPALNTFSLNAPSDHASITTYLTNSSTILFNWRKSNEGVKYKVKWGASLSNPKINVNSDNSGNDTTWTISNNDLAIMLINAGFNPGDSLIGIWAVYGYSGSDSLQSLETWNLTLKRRAKGDWLIAYDSTSSNGRISKDTASYNLNILGKTFDLYNRKGNTEASSLSFRGYKGLIWLGANTSVMSLVQKDSIKSYLLSGGITASNRSKLIIFAEDIGYTLDRTGSLYIDSAFAHGMLGFKYLTDYPGGTTGGRGIIGDVINSSLIDSTMNNYPDNLQSSWRNADRLYKFRITTDASGNAFGLNTQPTYGSAVFGTDMYALRNAIDGPAGSPALRILQQAFTYLAPSNIADINLLSPNGGEVWGVGSSQNITWTSTLIANVKIEYTSNDGASWSTIVESTPASAGTFSWSVPDNASTQYRVRLTDTSNPLIFSTSRNTFSVVLTWQSVMTVTDNGNLFKNLTFGQELNATDGIDISLGEAYLPPMPPAGAFDARFELPVIPVIHSIIDFRNDSLSAATWLLRFQPGLDGFPVTFTWNPSALPSGFFYLQDAYVGTLINVNMKTTGSYVITNSNFTALKIVYSQQACSNINLNTEWNIVSVPVAAVNMSTGTIFPNAIAETFLWSSTGYQSVTTLTNGLGYWLNYANQASVNICGVKVAASSIPLSEGWNMIGGYESDIPVSSITTSPSGILESPFYGYEDGYVQPVSLIPGKGYWIKSTQNGVINIPDGTAKIKNTDAVTSIIDPSWGSIIIRDRKGNERTLYTAKGQVNLNIYELPPLPPAGLFDVRFGSNRYVDILSVSDLIKITSAVYPFMITAIGTTVKLKDNITGRIIDRTLHSGESLIVDNNTINTLIVEGSEIPTEYILYQNYPNPFNPATTIKYGIPEKSIVRLTIYNILGQKVEELMNKELEPGYHSQVWNAVNLSSGIYFYEMRTDKFVSLKKLLLVK